MSWLSVKRRNDAAPLVFARADCGALNVDVNGSVVALRPSGAAFVEAGGVLVAGDLHLEKGSAYAARGQLLPPFDTRATLDRLEAEIAALKPRMLVLLGDSFHDPRAIARLSPDDARRIAALGWGLDLVWVEGNHDIRDGHSALDGLPGTVVETLVLGPLTLRHEPLPGLQPGEVSGHLHPCVRVVSPGRGSVRRRAFLTCGQRLILPAFGAYAGGLNALDAAFADLFAAPPLAGVLGEARVHPIGWTALRPD